MLIKKTKLMGFLKLSVKNCSRYNVAFWPSLSVKTGLKEEAWSQVSTHVFFCPLNILLVSFTGLIKEVTL